MTVTVFTLKLPPELDRLRDRFHFKNVIFFFQKRPSATTTCNDPLYRNKELFYTHILYTSDARVSWPSSHKRKKLGGLMGINAHQC